MDQRGGRFEFGGRANWSGRRPSSGLSLYYTWRPSGNQIQDVQNRCRIMTWLAGRQLCPAPRPPERGNRLHTGGIAGVDVVDGVADEQGLAWVASKPVQRYLYGFGVRLVSNRSVAAYDRIDVTSQADMDQSPQG